jgi:phosphomannomutase
MERRKLNVSGYRGIWGNTLNEKIITDYTRAFACFIKEDTGKENPTILIGRDGRESGPVIKKIIIKELADFGINVIDGDILPTPTVLFSVRKHKYDGGIIITASHNPIEYNGLKFINKDAFFITSKETEKINEYSERNIIPDKNKKGEILTSLDLPKEHVEKILEHVNLAKIQAKKFRVAVDMINGSACVVDPYLFEQLEAEVVPLNNIPNGKFTHRPEPLKENLKEIAKLVVDSKSDIGLVHDPDADRLVIINEFGEILREDYTLAFCLENILPKKRKEIVVANLSTSKIISDIVEKYECKYVQTKIGEPNVVEEMIKNNALIGGEPNGGVIYPAINFVRDSFTSLSLVLELLATRNLKVSEVVNSLPLYFFKKEKLPISGNLENSYSKLKKHFEDAIKNEEDGLHMTFKDNSWFHLRPSNTEPIIRLFAEAKTEERMNSLFEEVKLTLSLK